MSFADDVRKIGPKVDALLKVGDMLTPEVLEILNAVGNVDWNNIHETIEGAHKIEHAMGDVTKIANGMVDIQSVAKMETQVFALSERRKDIGLVAGNIKEIEKILDMREIMTNIIDVKNLMNDVVKIEPLLEEVLDMKGEIEATNFIAIAMHENMKKIEELQIQASNSSRMAADMLNKMNIMEKRIDEKLKRTEEAERRINGLDITVEYLAPGHTPYSRHNKQDGVLSLGIPTGKQGTKGKTGEGDRGLRGKPGVPGSTTNEGKQGMSGQNGDNFKVDIYGDRRELTRYGNRPIGTSFLALDESPAMIYFRKSNALDDWTEGQPFGISDGGLTLKELTDAVIIEASKRSQNG